jgi:hypothetical protein
VKEPIPIVEPVEIPTISALVNFLYTSTPDGALELTANETVFFE